MAIREQIHSDLAIPPGAYLAEVLSELGMAQAELARRMDRPIQAINEIVVGKKSITAETALQLENVTGVPANIWTGLEAEYRLVLARQEEDARRYQDADLVDPDLYRAMVKMGLVEPARTKVDKARGLCRFFGVDSLALVENAKHLGYAFRLGDRDGASGFALAAWLRIAELEANDVVTSPFDPAGLRGLIGQLRALTAESPESGVPLAQSFLASVGVAMVTTPHLPRTFANGATFWPAPDKAVVALSLRGAWADIFWFTLFHELGHVLLHGKRNPHVSFADSVDKKEVEANRFAADSLIPEGAFEAFLLGGRFSARDVREFSETIGVSPGVVVGRLQHEKHVPHSSLNNLRERYEFAPRMTFSA